jgi:hypothetical protein
MKTELVGKALFSATITLALLGASCAQHPPKQKSVAHDAVKALRKLEASTQVHPSYMQYNALVIDAKAEVNEVARVLPDGELKRHLNGAIEAYADAAKAWSAMGETLHGSYLSNRDEPGTGLSKRYEIDLDPVKMAGQKYEDALKEIGNPNYESPMKRSILEKIWAAARDHLDQASSLIERD